MSVSEDLALLGVASNGSTDQWDGLETVQGILLRWLQKPSIGFPDSGYEVWRAGPVDFQTIALSQQLNGKASFESTGKYALDSNLGLKVDASGLHVRPGEHVRLTFSNPAWYLELKAAQSPAGPVRVELFAGGRSRVVKSLSPGTTVTIRTRGATTVELSVSGGAGVVALIRYRPLHDLGRVWTKVAHVCLPVSHHAYSCGTFTGTAEDEAKSRVPPAVAVDWHARYSDGFNDLYPYLEGLATGQNVAFPQPTNPNEPKLSLDPQSAIMLAALDPHVARIVGLAWDDTGVPMDGKEWAYKITGRWGRPSLDVRLNSQEAWESIAEEVGIRSAKPLEIRYGGVLVETDPTTRAALILSAPCDEITLTIGNVAGHSLEIPWRALDAAGKVLAQGVSKHSPEPERELQVRVPGIKTIEFPSQIGTPVRLVVFRIVIGAKGFVEREAILPSIFATDPGPPIGPGWLTARVEQPGGTTPEQSEDAGPLQAGLLWELSASAEGVYDELAPVLYQVAGHQLSTNPAGPKPAAVPFDEHYLLNRDTPILVPSELVTVTDLRRRYYTDRGLKEGWRLWWARGIDLFGRVTEPSPPALERLVDDAPPPAPSILFAEYAQKDIPAQEAAVMGSSPLGREWLAANPTKNGIVVVFGWSPERVEQARDVDGFRLYVRRPAAVTNPGPNDPDESYDGVAWGPARSGIGPLPVQFDGVASSVSPFLSNVTVTTVTPLDDTHSSCATNLVLDTGGGALIGAELVSGSDSYAIVGNGEGTAISVAVEHLANAPPQPGTFEIQGGSSGVVSVVTNIAPPALAGPAIRRRTSGVLVGKSSRLAVLARTGGTFVCRQPPGPGMLAGDDVSWYPAYAVVIEDTGFGPAASPSRPVAGAQVAVTSVRRWSSREVESPESTPGGLTAVDATPPPAPVGFDLIPSGLHCAEVATRADWYGVSRVTLSWQAASELDYVVYRALGDAVFRLDREAHKTSPHVFPQSVWPADLWANQSRRTAVQNDIAALDAALASGTPEQIDAAYEGLRAGTQQLIAGQSVVEDAFAPRHSTPLHASSFTDELDGKSRAHWFYRFAARSKSGLESGKSLSTPPICCPDVVAPAAPLVQLALAAEGAVRLQWLPSPERDLARYLVYRTETDANAADVRDMELVAKVVPSPGATAAAGEVKPVAVLNKPWLEYPDTPPGGRDWIYRIVAVDTAGNASDPSGMLRGRALVPRPDPPVWNKPVRAASSVSLSWTHPSDKRLTCLIERSGSGSFWLPVSGWLPRGEYIFKDVPPDLDAAWKYRISVRDHLGRTAASAPVTQLAKAN